MFTGIVTAVGCIAARKNRGGDESVLIEAGSLDLQGAALGESIAVNGVCLTAVAFHQSGFWADVSAETLSLTTLGQLNFGQSVNLERALRLDERLGGHMVSGHVDGVGVLVERNPDGRSERMTFRAPRELMRFVAGKGSICIDGVSLTVNTVDSERFCVNIVPHTAENTSLGDLQPGDPVNLEVDIVARYLERLTSFSHNGQSFATMAGKSDANEHNS